MPDAHARSIIPGRGLWGTLAMTTDHAPFKVYAPTAPPGATPRLAPWATWLRVHGWWGWLPCKGVRTCTSVYPARICPCGMYSLIWKEQDDGEMTQSDSAAVESSVDVMEEPTMRSERRRLRRKSSEAFYEVHENVPSTVNSHGQDRRGERRRC